MNLWQAKKYGLIVNSITYYKKEICIAMAFKNLQQNLCATAS